ncbi:putative alcohol dehydrogenase [Blyttiomyces helicus]|uniref:Putative alcohol dehydrogenase n=1 Tax=Blyttiomyces helicus TaxID=388810 RepID=A0A4P9WG17_9FUNG|nr:putative alcohol dehydrogenase [Blyttiomyces helicus]|eukprot:RKO91282.1 putative alcohol dehydrogenase [Blyttiomyces helicus]
MAAQSLPPNYSKYVVHTLSNNFEQATKLVTLKTADLVAGLAPTQVIVKYLYWGCNASDTNYTAGRYDTRVQPPFDCGFEAIGEVVAVGTSVRRAKVGMAVGVMSYGAFSELQAVDERLLLPFPAARPEYLPLIVSGLTSYLALKHCGRMTTKETVLVTAAAGGAGQIAVQLARAAGNHVIGTCSSESKAKVLRELGCDRVINYKTEDVGAVLKKEYRKGIDIIFESVGGEMLQTCFKSLAIKGRLIIIGSMSSYAKETKPGEPINSFAGIWTDSFSTVDLLNKSATVTGFFLNHFVRDFGAALADMTKAVQAGKLKPLVETQDFEGLTSIPRAISYLQAGKNVGKVIVPLHPVKAAKL